MKISSILILLFSLSSIASATTCDVFKSLRESKTMCWVDEHKAWVSEGCLKNAKCDALKSLKDKNLKAEKEVFRDKRGNEFIFAVFKDKSHLNTESINERTE